MLREMSHGDFDVLFEMLGHPEVMRYWPRPYTRSEAVEWLERALVRYARDGCGHWFAIDKESQEAVGQIGVVFQEVEGVTEPEIGYMLRREHWGKGYATEGASACLRWSQERYPRTVCVVRPENEPSLRVARAIGLNEERRVMFKDFVHILFSDTRPAPG